MRIGLLIDDSLDYPDGVQQYTLTLGEWLSSHGHNVMYITSSTKRDDVQSIHSLGRNIKVSFNGNTLRIPLPISRRRARKFLSTNKLDVLHVQMPYSPFFAGKFIHEASKETRIVGTFHVAPYARLQSVTGPVLAWFSKRTLCKFDQICSVSESAQAYAQSAFGVPSTVIPNVVHTERYTAAVRTKANTHPDNNSIRVGFLGRHVPRKGCMQLLAALRFYHEQNWAPRLTVMIGGSGSQTEKLKTYAQNYNLSELVSFCGFVQEKDKAQFFADQDILVFPSLGGESFGIILVEAMAASSGVVIGGDNPGYRAVMADDTCVFNPNDTQGFAHLLHSLARNPQQRKQLSIEQSKRAAMFDVGTVGPTILQQLYGASQQ